MLSPASLRPAGGHIGRFHKTYAFLIAVQTAPPESVIPGRTVRWTYKDDSCMEEHGLQYTTKDVTVYARSMTRSSAGRVRYKLLSTRTTTRMIDTG